MARKPTRSPNLLVPLWLLLISLVCGEVGRATDASPGQPQWPTLQTSRKVPSSNSPTETGPIAGTIQPTLLASPTASSAAYPAVPSFSQPGTSPATGAEGAKNLGQSAALPPRRVRNEAGRPRARTQSYESLSTVGGSLAIVLTAFLALVWLAKRGQTGRNAALPEGVLEILGRASLPGRQHLQLIRLGPKLVLICVTPTTAETLAEITDPQQVESLTAQCRRAGRGSASDLVHHVLTQHGTGERSSLFSPHRPTQAASIGQGRSGSRAEMGHV